MRGMRGDARSRSERSDPGSGFVGVLIRLRRDRSIWTALGNRYFAYVVCREKQATEMLLCEKYLSDDRPCGRERGHAPPCESVMTPVTDLDPAVYPRDYYTRLRAVPVEELFRREVLIVSAGSSVLARDVYDAYVRYCHERLVAPQRAIVLSRHLEGAGVERGVSLEGKVWMGVTLGGRP